MFGWVNFAFLARVVESSELSTIFLKIAWFVTPIFFLLILYFAVDIFAMRPRLGALLKFNSIMCLTLSLVTGFTDLVIHNRVLINDSLAIQYGKLMFPFLIGVFIIILSTIYVVLRGFKSEMSIEERKGITWYVVGLLVFYIANFVFNISLPIFFGATQYYYFGDYSTIILTFVIAYSIIRYEFLGVNVLVSTFLISTIGMFLILDITLLSDSIEERLVKIFIFFMFLIVAVLLIRNILTTISQKERLQQLAQEQKDIIDVMGHEIRTPLTAIVQELNIHKKLTLPKKEDWMAGKVSPEQTQEYLELIFESLETMDKASVTAVSLVKSMLETARLDKNRFELNYSKFDVIPVVRDSVEIMSKTIAPDECKVEFVEPEFEKFEIEADKTRISEAVSALVSNSIKYRDQDKSQPWVKVLVKKVGNNCQITVKDNGIGIAKEDISKLGRKFMRLDSRATGNLKRPGGTGLGLYVVKGIMKHHGGKLIIESEGHGKGSSFTINFPTSRNDAKDIKKNPEN
ncbi:hypothetical protein GF357_01090 [Candidatus Dojkabacteria bacterium]|nr:hypothetical protein [Candidatus Dojkabacteria bacterium]